MNGFLSDKITIDSIQAVYKKKAYELGIGVNYLNIFGVRANTGFTNTFDDILGVFYKDGNDAWILEKWEGTTDPGTNGLLNPVNAKGVAIVVPGYYKGLWKIGLHKGKYEALVQKGTIKLYRDNDKDTQYDLDPATIESVNGAGINFHHAGQYSKEVNDWSLGCQVLARIIDDQRKMALAHIHENIYGNSFDYSLFKEEDFV